MLLPHSKLSFPTYSPTHLPFLTHYHVPFLPAFFCLPTPHMHYHHFQPSCTTFAYATLPTPAAYPTTHCTHMACILEIWGLGQTGQTDWAVLCLCLLCPSPFSHTYSISPPHPSPSPPPAYYPTYHLAFSGPVVPFLTFWWAFPSTSLSRFSVPSPSILSLSGWT